MSLLSWFGKKIKLSDGAFWGTWFGGSSWSGRTVTVERAMKLSAWWACVRLVSETIATLPLGVYEKRDAEKRPVPDHPLNDLLRGDPNTDQTSVEFWEGQVAPVCIAGNSYAEKRYMGERLVSLLPIPFEDCRPYRDRAGDLRYRFTDRGKVEDLPADKVFHIRGFGTGGDLGLSPVAYARNSLGGAMDVDEAASRVFGTGLRAAGFLLSPQLLDKKQREQVRENLLKPLEGPEGEGKTGLLEGGWKWQPTNIPPKDAEMIMTARYRVEDICRWMGVPPVLVGHSADGQTMWGSGIEQIMLGWLTLGLRAYIKRIEAAVNKRLIAPAERGRVFVEFNVDGLVRADSAGRAALMSVLSQNGLRTRNELRGLDNMAPLAGGDQLTVQSNLVPIDQLGNAGGDAAVREAIRSWLGITERKDEP